MSAATVRRAEEEILSCDSCDRDATTRFQGVLDRLVHRAPNTTHYVLTKMPKCPGCSSPLFEDTLVELGLDWYQE